MIKSLIIPSVVVNEEKHPIGWSSIIIVGKKVIDLSGNNDDNFNYNSLLVTAMIEGLGKLKVNSEVTFMLLPKDWRMMCNYKVFESKCSEKVLKDYLDIISFHEIHGKRLPKDFKLPTEREVHEAPEAIAESFEAAFEMPPEDEDDGSFYIDEYSEEDVHVDNTEEEVMTTPIEAKIAKPAPTPIVSNESVVMNKKEENNMKVNVSYVINGVKTTKEVSLQDAIAFLTRADQRNVPAYYTANKQSFLNKAAQAMTKKPAILATVKVSSEAVIPTVDLWVDGACSNNGAENAKAGWGACLVFGDKQKELNGIVEGEQTNNRAEMTAVIEGLTALKKHCKVLIYTDSQVVTRAPAIIERDYKTAAGKPAANKDLLEKLATEFKKHDVTILKVEGHAGVDLNEKCDALARAAVVAAK